eukprot:jgi/Bigna1/138874/aug1.47_g13582
MAPGPMRGVRTPLQYAVVFALGISLLAMISTLSEQGLAPQFKNWSKLSDLTFSVIDYAIVPKVQYQAKQGVEQSVQYRKEGGLCAKAG